MGQIEAEQEDRRNRKEARRKYRGTARVRLEYLYHRNPPNAKNVGYLESVLKLAGPHHEANPLPALVDQAHLDAALKKAGINAADLLKSKTNLTELEFPDGYSVEVLQGADVIQAAKESLHPSTKWWTVQLYSIDISDELKTSLSEKTSYEKTLSDCEIYYMIEHYHRLGRPDLKDDWVARLRGSRQKNLKLLENSQLVQYFKRLWDIRGLWDGRLLSVIHTVLAMRSTEEVSQYLVTNVYDVLVGLLQEGTHHHGDKINQATKKNLGKVDKATIKQIALLAPGVSREDAKALRAKVKGGEIFHAFRKAERDRIWDKLKLVKQPILTISSFFDDVLYLGEIVDCMKWIVSVPPHKTVRWAIENCYTGRNQKKHLAIIQVSETKFVSVPGNEEDRIDLGRRQLIAFAMREYPNIPKPGTKYRVAQARTKAVKKVLGRFAYLANHLGFESPEISKLLKKHLVTQDLECSTLSSNLSMPVLVTPGSGEPRDARSGKPRPLAHEEDKRFLFVNNLHKDDFKYGDGVTSFFITKSKYLAFFGRPRNTKLITEGQEAFEDSYSAQDREKEEERYDEYQERKNAERHKEEKEQRKNKRRERRKKKEKKRKGKGEQKKQEKEAPKEEETLIRERPKEEQGLKKEEEQKEIKEEQQQQRQRQESTEEESKQYSQIYLQPLLDPTEIISLNGNTEILERMYLQTKQEPVEDTWPIQDTSLQTKREPGEGITPMDLMEDTSPQIKQELGEGIVHMEPMDFTEDTFLQIKQEPGEEIAPMDPMDLTEDTSPQIKQELGEGIVPIEPMDLAGDTSLQMKQEPEEEIVPMKDTFLQLKEDSTLFQERTYSTVLEALDNDDSRRLKRHTQIDLKLPEPYRQAEESPMGAKATVVDSNSELDLLERGHTYLDLKPARPQESIAKKEQLIEENTFLLGSSHPGHYNIGPKKRETGDIIMLRNLQDSEPYPEVAQQTNEPTKDANQKPGLMKQNDTRPQIYTYTESNSLEAQWDKVGEAEEEISHPPLFQVLLRQSPLQAEQTLQSQEHIGDSNGEYAIVKQEDTLLGSHGIEPKSYKAEQFDNETEISHLPWFNEPSRSVEQQPEQILQSQVHNKNMNEELAVIKQENTLLESATEHTRRNEEIAKLSFPYWVEQLRENFDGGPEPSQIEGNVVESQKDTTQVVPQQQEDGLQQRSLEAYRETTRELQSFSPSQTKEEDDQGESKATITIYIFNNGDWAQLLEREFTSKELAKYLRRRIEEMNYFPHTWKCRMVNADSCFRAVTFDESNLVLLAPKGENMSKHHEFGKEMRNPPMTRTPNLEKKDLDQSKKLHNLRSRQAAKNTRLPKVVQSQKMYNLRSRQKPGSEQSRKVYNLRSRQTARDTKTLGSMQDRKIYNLRARERYRITKPSAVEKKGTKKHDQALGSEKSESEKGKATRNNWAEVMYQQRIEHVETRHLDPDLTLLDSKKAS